MQLIRERVFYLDGHSYQYNVGGRAAYKIWQEVGRNIFAYVCHGIDVKIK